MVPAGAPNSCDAIETPNKDVSSPAMRRPTLKDNLLRKGTRSVFWKEHKLPPPPPPKAQPPPFYTEGPTHQHPGNSKALAVFWDLDRFDIAGDHERCRDAVNAIRSFCNQFAGLSAGARQHARGTVRMTGYAQGGSDPDAEREKLQADAVVPENAGRRAGIRVCSDDAGLKELAMARLIPGLTVVEKDAFREGNGGTAGAVRRDCPQMLTDLLVWMLDCTQQRLFVPTAVVISDDPYVMSALSMLAARGAYIVLLTNSGLRDRKRGNMQVVLPFEQVAAAHMPLGTPPLRVVDHAAVQQAEITQHESPRKSKSEDGTRRYPTRGSASTSATPAEPSPQHTPRPRPATSPSKSPARWPRTRPETSPSKSVQYRQAELQAKGETEDAPKLRAGASRPASARPRALSASGSAGHRARTGGTRIAAGEGPPAPNGSHGHACAEEDGAGERAVQDALAGTAFTTARDGVRDAREKEAAAEIEARDAREEEAAAEIEAEALRDESSSVSPRGSRAWGGVGGGSGGSSPCSPRVPLVGDELGASAKMWCCWSKTSLLGVGEAVSVKRSDGRYTLGVVVGLGAAGHYSTIHEHALLANEVEILCDFHKTTGQRVTRINRIETVGKFPSTANGRASSLSEPNLLGRWSALEDKMGVGAWGLHATRPSSVKPAQREGSLRPHVVRPHTALPAGQRAVSFSTTPIGSTLERGQDADPVIPVALSPRKVVPVGGHSQARPVSAL